MKKITCLFSLLLAIVLVLTSVGIVFADETPPPLDDQTLLPPTTLISPGGYAYLFYNSGINFNWSSVAGADKYLLEVQHYDTSKGGYVNAIPPMTISSKTSPVPPTVATVAIKKPFTAGTHRWRVTAINTDVGSDPAGTGQASSWQTFYIRSQNMTLIDMFPGALASPAVAYSGAIDYKKGDGTNTDTPTLNWIVNNGGSSLGNVGGSSSIYFKVTLSEGRNKYTKIIPAAGNCTTYYFSNANNEDAVCSTDLSSFTPALSALTLKTTYTWEVVGVDQPDPVLFPTPAQIMPAMKDTLQYNSSSYFPILSGAVVTDSIYTNKPTFNWEQPAGSIPEGSAYQLVVEGYNPAKTPIAWKTVASLSIVPGKTKIPKTSNLACPVSSEPCAWVFATPFTPRWYYRWNVRVTAAGKYGPWVNPGTSSDPDDMVRDGNSDASQTIVYDTKPGLFNYFSISDKPFQPEVAAPIYGNISNDANPTLIWSSSALSNNPLWVTVPMSHYQINLARVSPSALTKTINIEKTPGAGGLVCALNCTINAPDYLPTEYTAFGLPRGVYHLTITPKNRSGNGQWYTSSPVIQSPVSTFTIGPAAPIISAATYNPTSKKMSVTFAKDTSAPAANVKYRLLVKMEYGSLWRWVKIGTYAGASCPDTGTNCTLDFFAYKPGTKNALEGGIAYKIQIQEALKEEGNTKTNLNKNWGPFGLLGGNFTVTPW